MSLPLPLDYPPMEALAVGAIPAGPEWLYEPKWDGFRCLAFRDGPDAWLRSKSGQPLERYFPDVTGTLLGVRVKRFVLDGEIVVPVGNRLSFDELLLRIHPAASRVARLADKHPALLIVFDLLVDGRGTSLVDRPLRDRRPRLETFAARQFREGARVCLSPASPSAAQARRWLRSGGRDLDGIIAKRLDLPYRSGDRTGMQKIKQLRTADCVVGGFRYATRGGAIGSLLLGLYDADGLLHHVGFTSSFRAMDRHAIAARVLPLREPPGFTGRRPGGPSRWSTERSGEWEPVRPELVVEVQYDHFSGNRFRHGTKLLRWRPDKAPRQCTMEQVKLSSRAALTLLR